MSSAHGAVSYALIPGKLLAPMQYSATAGRMNKPLPLLAGFLGIVFIALAVIYWLTPAGSLPAFFPGFEAGSSHVHFKHALGSLILALSLFAFAWFQSARGDA
jgi:hypothetical protein